MTAPLPLPATPEAIGMGCLCSTLYIPPFPQSAIVHPDCPLHSESARAATTHDGECDRAQPLRLDGGAV